MSRKRRERRESQRAAGTGVAQRPASGVAETYMFQGTEFVDRRDWGPIGWGFQNGFGYGLNLMSSLNDRRDGRNAPFVENEYDAKTIRGFARFITTVNCPGIGIVETLQNYIIGRGIKVRVSPKKRRQAPDGLVDVAQDVIDEFNEDNKVIGDYDRESVLADRVDGEGYIGLYPKAGKTALRPIEPDSVTDPGGAPFSDEELQEVYGVQLQFPTRWSFGHHTDAHDIMNCHGYCVRWEPSDPFDYLPARFVHHSKVNVRRNVLRGMSDFYPAWKWLKQQERLLSNTGEGAAELAAIAYITQFSTGTQEQVRSMRQGQADFEYRRVGMNGSGQTVYKHLRDPGTVLNVPQGQEYLPGPMGHERGQAFLDVVQGILRQVAVRWGMTEGMVSADDSNNNMASSVEAGSRFWKYADASQGRECSKWQAIYMRVLENAHEMGRFEKFGLTWAEVKAVLVIAVTCPEIDVRDPKIMADTREVEKRNGVLSAQTWADEAGYDHEKEVSQGATDSEASAGADPSGQPRQAGEYEDKSRLQWKRNVKAIKDILDSVQSEGMTAGHAKIQLGLLGLPPEKVDALLADVADGSLTPENQQSLSESYAAHVSPHWRLIREALPIVLELSGGNPNHDPGNGEFASGGGSGGGGKSVAKPKSAPGGNSKPEKSAGGKTEIHEHLATHQAAQVESHEFKQWFGGSKLVNNEGKPLVLYHATDADFTQFDTKFSRKSDIRGFYFGTDKTPHVTIGERKNLLPVYIKMDNPASMEDVQRIAKSGVKTPQLHAALKKEGFDGIYAPKDKMVIAFDPQQIKSAIANQGSFNPKSKNIYESGDSEPLQYVLLEVADSFRDYP